MKGPDIAKKLAKGSEGLAIASSAEKRCVFVTPIVDVLLGFCIDRTSSAAENVLMPFAFPLAFGDTSVTLDSTFPMQHTRFNPQEKDCVERARELLQQHVEPWLRVRRTLEGLIANTPRPEKGYSYSLSTHIYSRGHGPSVVRFVKLLCLVERIGEAGELIDDATQEFEKFAGESIAEDDYRELLTLRSAIVDTSKAARTKYWSEARQATLSALKIDPVYLPLCRRWGPLTAWKAFGTTARERAGSLFRAGRSHALGAHEHSRLSRAAGQ